MSLYKRAPALRAALWLGLFFCSQCVVTTTQLAADEVQETSAPLALEVSAKTGTLWVEDDGAAFYWQSGVAFSFGEYFFLGFDLGKVSSNLPWLDGSLFGFMTQCGFDTPLGGFTVAVGVLDSSPVDAAINKLAISNDGGDGYFFSIKAPLRFGPLLAAPYLQYAKASWDDGDLYWFFGKPKFSSLLIYGVDFSLDQQEWYQHNLCAYGFSAALQIISNEDQPLFDADLNAGLFSYQFSREGEKTEFTGTIGWFFAGASLEGSLNSSNQPYFLFPYLYYDVNAHYKVQAGFAGFRFRHNVGIFRYSLNLGALHIFYDRGGVDLHYQEKKLFGGKEAFDTKAPELKGLGTAFLLLEAGFSALPLTEKLRLSLSLQKAFVVPWGYEKLLASDAAGSEKPSSVDTRSLLRTAFLSGVSIRGSLSW